MISSLQNTASQNGATGYRLGIVRNAIQVYGLAFTLCNHKSKKPSRLKWNSEQRIPLDELEAHIRAGGNYAVRTGDVSGGIIVLDIDDPAALDDLPELPETVTVNTPRGGLHLYYRLPLGESVGCSSGNLPRGIDVRGNGGCALFAGSLGGVYQFKKGRSLDEKKIAILPRKVLNMIQKKTTPYGRSALEGEYKKVRGSQQGERNNQLNSSAFNIAQLIREDHIDEEEAREALTEAGINAGLDEREIQATIESGMEAGKKNPRTPNGDNGEHHAERDPVRDFSELERVKTTELTVAKAAGLLKEDCNGDLLHHSGLGWFVWNGKYWERSEKAPEQRAQSVADRFREIVREQDLRNPDVVREYYRFAKELERPYKYREVLEYLKPQGGIDASKNKWDSHPWLLNCPNGVVDLSTGELRAHDRELHITALCPTEYKPEAKAERWEKFLNEVFRGDGDLINYVQWALGYALTGDMSHHLFFILHGAGRNGKSTLLELMKEILGPDYSVELSPKAMFKGRHEEHATFQAQLRGKRFGTCIETSGGARLDEAFIKKVTSGDEVTANYMRHDPFTFKPQVKIFYGTNHAPEIRDNSPAMWSRVRMIPFQVNFEQEGTMDKGLREKLLEEKEGILAWFVEGAMRVRAGEPKLPEKVKTATSAYRATNDTLEAFIEEHCIREKGARVPKKDFSAACLSSAVTDYTSPHEVTRGMREKGFTEGKHKGMRVWKGIGLRKSV